MDQVQVDVTQTQLLERSVKGFEGAVIPRVLHPQLCDEEQLLPGHPGTAERCADSGFIFIGCGGVKQAVTGLHRL